VEGTHRVREPDGLHNASEANRAGLANPAVPEPVVFIVSYHNLDYAKEACEFVSVGAPEAREKIQALAKIDLRPFDWVYDLVNADDECKSVPDPRELGRRLESELASALVVNPLCNRVTVVNDPHPHYDSSSSDTLADNFKIKNQRDYWNLHLDYNPGHKTYGWTLFSYKAGGYLPGSFVTGAGETPKVADQICTVVTKRGAIISSGF
jgi:hypothetical protein